MGVQGCTLSVRVLDIHDGPPTYVGCIISMFGVRQTYQNPSFGSWTLFKHLNFLGSLLIFNLHLSKPWEQKANCNFSVLSLEVNIEGALVILKEEEVLEVALVWL